MKAHWLRLDAVVHPTELEPRVVAAMQTIAGQAVPERIEADAQHGGILVLLRIELKRNRDIRHVLGNLIGMPTAEIDARVDEDGVFHCRFDKQAAAEGRVQVTRGDDAIQMRLRPMVHPARREGAVQVLAAFLDPPSDAAKRPADAQGAAPVPL